MNSALHPSQQGAVEKLKTLKVGALYIDRQDGKLRTIAELVRYRMETKRIDSVIWLCARRKQALLAEGISKHLYRYERDIALVGVENLSYCLEDFLILLRQAEEDRVMLVIDNGLLIKNPCALRTKRVLLLSERCPYRLLVSDVPLARCAADMFTQWYALDWRILGYQSYWAFCLNHVGRGRSNRNIDYIARRIEPYCAQLLREEVQPVGARREYVWRFRLPPPAMAEYEQVVQRFVSKACFSRSGVYRMLQACQHAASGRRIVCDYPLQVEDMYADPQENPRLISLMELLAHFPQERLLIICRYSCECAAVEAAIARQAGRAQVCRYPAPRGEPQADARILVMSCYVDEREDCRLQADVIIYYTSDWNWRKRQEKERQCQGALEGRPLTVVSLVAVNTIDERILRCVWRKDQLIQQWQKELVQQCPCAEENNAENL